MTWGTANDLGHCQWLGALPMTWGTANDLGHCQWLGALPMTWGTANDWGHCQWLGALPMTWGTASDLGWVVISMFTLSLHTWIYLDLPGSIHEVDFHRWPFNRGKKQCLKHPLTFLSKSKSSFIPWGSASLWSISLCNSSKNPKIFLNNFRTTRLKYSLRPLHKIRWKPRWRVRWKVH